jgi:hypothetical protein
MATKTPKKTKKLTKLQKARREIARRNKLFAAADAAEKRVLIAKDVIAQIKNGNFKAAGGTWVRPMTARHLGNLSVEFGADASLRELVLTDKLGKCDCCALGAMFMSCTLYNNKTTAEDFEQEVNDGAFDFLVEDKGSISNGLNTFFSPAQLRLIEMYFERGYGAWSPRSDAETARVELWYETYSTDRSRLLAIMQNIVDNNGTFKP